MRKNENLLRKRLLLNGPILNKVDGFLDIPFVLSDFEKLNFKNRR